MGPVPNPEDQRDHPSHNGDSDIENAEHPDVMISVEVTDSDSDDDDDDSDVQGGYMGYHALLQDGDADRQDSDSDEENQMENVMHEQDNPWSFDSEASGVQVPEGLIHQVRNVGTVPGYMQVPDLPRPDKKELLWNQTRPTDITLDTGQAEKIKSVMSGIQLPSTNIPDWARNLSEEQWQEQVVKKLTSHGTSSGEEVHRQNNQNTEQLETVSRNSAVTDSICDGSPVTRLSCDGFKPH